MINKFILRLKNYNETTQIQYKVVYRLKAFVVVESGVVGELQLYSLCKRKYKI